ncbi:Cof-type HAD-IIB family hydrolase [Microbacterium aoyamense]|uniref:Cof-type HAD-IIB family hydrolase n=1 Tax=Microbacterium aoyamense TaxID=344166 RepID=A0ABN2PJZ2_9MICO|nr:Cof-type HAD-IIB family hydrolase [Microbacterium aoyamense]
MASLSRIVFIDVDGTILEHGSRVAASTVDAIQTARAAGHRVLLCTGRAQGDIDPAVLAIGFDGAVTNGGVTAYVGDELVVSRLLTPASVDRLVTAMQDLGIHYFLQTDDEVFATAGMTALVREWVRALQADDDARGVTRPENSLAGLATRTYRDVTFAPEDAIAKAVFVSLEDDGLERLQVAVGDEFHIVPGSIPLPGGSNGEVCLLGTNKGTAIELVLAHLGEDPQDVIGIGDSWNDVEMFEVCGTSVAMGNAEPELKALADFVTTSVADDGVWNAFVRLGLIEG